MQRLLCLFLLCFFLQFTAQNTFTGHKALSAVAAAHGTGAGIVEFSPKPCACRNDDQKQSQSDPCCHTIPSFEHIIAGISSPVSGIGNICHSCSLYVPVGIHCKRCLS